MVLHSASRLGVLSYFYQQRHEIAYAIGLIAEVPIAMCSSDYHVSNDLVIVSHDDATGTVPPAIISAKEIQLFFVNTLDDVRPSRSIAIITHESPFIEKRYSPPALSIFHPPS
jgi:hypothetical protein